MTVTEDKRLTPGRPAPVTSTDSFRPFDPILTKVQGQTIAFDLETRGNNVQWTDPPGTHVKLGSFVIGGGEAQLTTEGPALRVGTERTLLDLLLVAETLSGHGIMNYDLLVLHQQYPELFPTPWELANAKRLWDTQLVESLLDPASARMKEGEAQKHYKLENIAQRRGFPAGKSLDLSNWAKRHGGFENIPWEDDRQNIDLLEYARQDARLVWELVRDQLKRYREQPRFQRVTKKVKVPIPNKDRHYQWVDQQVSVPAPTLSMAYIEREHKVAAIAAQIQFNGFRIDTDLLRKRIDEGEAKKARILADLQEKYNLPTHTADGKEAKSPQSTKLGKRAIRRAFWDTGLDRSFLPTKPKSGEPDLSKETMQAIVDHSDNPRAAALAEVIMDLNGIRSIYAQVQDSLVGDRVHPSISFRQASGRWSFTKPGLTVVGKRSGRVVEREVFIAEEGHVMLTADLSQVDARAVAAMSQDKAYMALFAEGRDLWTELSQRFGITRDAVKVIGHGSNYGQGAKGVVKHNPSISLKDAEAFHREMQENFPDLIKWQNQVRWLAQNGILLDNGWGRLLRVDKDRAYTQAPALSGQSAARDIMMQGLLNLAADYPDALPMLRAIVHDEVVMSVPEDLAEDLAYRVNKAMTFPWAPRWGGDPIQIRAEATIGNRTWASAYGKG